MSTLAYNTLFIFLIFFHSNHISAQTNAEPSSASVTLDISLKVKGITCSNDLKTISDNVAKIKGVTGCTPGKKGATSTFIVTYNPALVSEKDIVEVIEDTPGCKNPKDRPYKVKI